MPYGSLEVVGAQAFNELFVPDSVQRHALGLMVSAHDPYFGFGEFVYLKAESSLGVGDVVAWSNAFVAVVNPTTTATGRPVAVARNTFANPSFGWFQLSGLGPVKCPSGTTGPLYQSAGTAGTLTTTLRASAQILNASSLVAASGTITKQATTQNGSAVIRVNNVDGLWVGQAASGTGIAASTITAIDPSQRLVTLSANCTATGTVTATFTYTGFVLAQFNRPFVQGNIT